VPLAVIASRAMLSRSWALALAVPCLVVAGCGNSVPSFPEVRRDAGLECGDFDGGSLGECASGEVCLEGLCYEQCSATRPCGPREECSPQGVCVLSTTDAGPPVDAGPPDPCDIVTCEAPTPYCRAGTCLACEGGSDCNALAPVCDLARGTCATFNVAGLCAACNADAECMAIDASYRCVTRDAPAPLERVCLPSCEAGAACPQGFSCDGTSMRCVPRLNFSCTGVRRAIDAVSCDDGAGAPADTICAPVAATAETGLFTGSCYADGVRAGFTCHVPCGAGGDTDCPAGTCDTVTGFCR
jgi:hypothetical protein